MSKILSVAVALLSFVGGLRAEQIIGCPKGIAKGVLWPKIMFRTQSFTEKWSSQTESMVAMDSGSKGWSDAGMTAMNLRLGYGLTHSLNVSVGLETQWSNGHKWGKGGVLQAINTSAISRIWTSGQWIFFDQPDMGLLRNVKLSLGGAYGAALYLNDDKLMAGLGPGVDEFRLGPLWHLGLGRTGLECAGHLIYAIKGKAREVAGWNRSGQDIPDTLNYQLNFEYAPFSFVECSVGVTGWLGVERDAALGNMDGSRNRGFMHAIMLQGNFFPMGGGYEKRKIMVNINIPYARRVMRAVDITVAVGVMWTFYTE